MLVQVEPELIVAKVGVLLEYYAHCELCLGLYKSESLSEKGIRVSFWTAWANLFVGDPPLRFTNILLCIVYVVRAEILGAEEAPLDEDVDGMVKVRRWRTGEGDLDASLGNKLADTRRCIEDAAVISGRQSVEGNKLVCLDEENRNKCRGETFIGALRGGGDSPVLVIRRREDQPGNEIPHQRGYSPCLLY